MDIFKKIKFKINNNNKSLGSMRNSTSGFTLIEIIVAISLFTVVAFISVGALLTVADANRKAQVLKTVMNNLNFSLESMSREIRVGSTYYCNDITEGTVPGGFTIPRNCSTGGNFFAFETSGGNSGSSLDQVMYRLNGNIIEKSVDGGNNFIDLTPPELRIESSNGLRFYVTGALAGDTKQPKVTIVIKGEAGLKDKIVTDFSLQTSVSQRFRDD